jgi:hypothetical protein
MAVAARKSIFDESIAASEARKRHAAERAARIDAHVGTLLVLPQDEREDVLAALAKAMDVMDGPAPSERAAKKNAMAGRAVPAKRAARRPRILASPGTHDIDAASYVEKAILFVRAHPEGVRGVDVARAIGQDEVNVSATLRNLMSRSLIEKRERRWFPTSVTPTVRLTLETAIKRVLGDGKPRGGGDLFRAVKTLLPGAKKPSVISQLVRMKQAGDVVECGRGPLGALYGLKEGGAAVSS